MYPAPFDPTVRERAQLGVVVGEIHGALSCLGSAATGAEHRTAARALVASWARLVALMAHGAPRGRPEGA